MEGDSIMTGTAAAMRHVVLGPSRCLLSATRSNTRRTVLEEHGYG
jgi:hypothetical protein